ncbi:tRNA isopentenyl-2-thiomethyl-A-37 hydroxylase MiaE [Vibrio parahaemolyticus]|uniref:tRNA isopentenyl-2-thiomethyl-A-37 hydroxylase MiaE n=1 Tax=Vibrio parahaemolyticus TaxID=670 RepID=UPI00215D4150|nr:tRNA isopentenyl-2-thiomethyl-A-37 hydroxylase MiaE [Vibrio parahaemolyticus]EGR1573431.1 tRNA-(ms[2]io[6]A)-hydroxylase [Vibrio alginolyticus]MCR9649540.1 tRNA isopentenyl-2-thiomethyl-A-37 hydroxylase MiaE [Vibrio parahaemolyticus]MCR9805431.1 tRNA isopentenyl-2-thiomethyl-A-37 hydroxylase MiaE [Vibrio parahaemolyticus]
MFDNQLLTPINNFLKCSTPDQWIDEARKPENLSVILRDHLLCELKASQSAVFLLKRYALTDEGKQQIAELVRPYEDFAYKGIGSLETLKGKSNISKSIKPKNGCAYGQDMIDKMVLLIREELHHFYQVLEIIEQQGLEYRPITASRYAKGMIKHIRTFEPAALIDKLIVGAFIEARSCERFAKLAPFLDEPIQKFYISLLRSEARHYQDYLELAEQIANEDISERIEHFANVEAQLISTDDPEFRFHSGLPRQN